MMWIIFFFFIIILSLIFVNPINENFEITDKTYIFWTGGYDSTFRICQALLEKKKIIPVYISYKHLDNQSHKNFKRQSQKNEILAMDNIRKTLIKKYPKLGHNLEKTIVVPKLKIDKDIIISMENLYKQRRNHRPLSQYGGLAQVTRDLNKDIEIAVENSKHSTMRNMVKQYIRKSNKGIRLYKPDKDISIFSRFIYPTIHTTKAEMYHIAKKNGFDDILDMTWTCWFPENGKQCGKCTMCRQRYFRDDSIGDNKHYH